jgi:hypothetical protein
MWELYDRLIEDIPAGLRVDEALQGGHWNMVRSGSRIGLAMDGSRLVPETRPRTITPPFTGMELRDLAHGGRCAQAAKSWNFAEASVGMAAIGACAF